MLKTLFVAALVAGVIMLGGCNTVAGVGKDIEKVGDKIENKAEEKKQY
jgi:predicted small secreted protein